MRVRLFLVLVVTLVSAGLCFGAQETGEQAAALQAETAWLSLVDQGDYHEAWARAAKMMQAAAPEGKFTDAVRGARAPLGAITTRTLKHAEAATKLPGAPDGHYVVAQYTTQFAHKAEGIETVVASQEANGSWHVSGYFVR